MSLIAYKKIVKKDMFMILYNSTVEDVVLNAIHALIQKIIPVQVAKRVCSYF